MISIESRLIRSICLDLGPLYPSAGCRNLLHWWKLKTHVAMALSQDTSNPSSAQHGGYPRFQEDWRWSRLPVSVVTFVQ